MNQTNLSIGSDILLCQSTESIVSRCNGKKCTITGGNDLNCVYNGIKYIGLRNSQRNSEIIIINGVVTIHGKMSENTDQ